MTATHIQGTNHANINCDSDDNDVGGDDDTVHSSWLLTTRWKHYWHLLLPAPSRSSHGVVNAKCHSSICDGKAERAIVYEAYQHGKTFAEQTLCTQTA